MSTQIEHRGINWKSRSDRVRERVLSDLWAEVNQRAHGFNGGGGTLELILYKGPNSDPMSIFVSVAEITQRDATVAATVIQWLGSNCGRDFLDNYQRVVKAMKDIP